MKNTTKIWLHGLGAAAVGSAASSLGPMLVAPATFNLTSLHGLANVCLSSVIAGFASAAFYLSKSPLPPLPPTLEAGDKLSLTNPTISTTGEMSADSAIIQKAPASFPENGQPKAQ